MRKQQGFTSAYVPQTTHVQQQRAHLPPTREQVVRGTIIHRMETSELIAKIQGRVDQCRRLANSTTDQRTALTLRGMADEGEADIKRIREEGSHLN